MIKKSFKQVFFSLKNKDSKIITAFHILVTGTLMGLFLGVIFVYYFYMHEDSNVNSSSTAQIKVDLLPKTDLNNPKTLDLKFDLNHAKGEAGPVHQVLSSVDEDRDIEQEEELNPNTTAKNADLENAQALLQSTDQTFNVAKDAAVEAAQTSEVPVENAQAVGINQEPIESLNQSSPENENQANQTQLSGSAPVVESVPSSPSKGSVDLTLDDIVLSKNKSHYTIQLLGTQSYAELMSVYKEYQGQMNLLYANTPQNNKDWYILLLGDFATRDDAVNQLSNLPPNFKQNSPWIRDWANIHENMKIHY